MFAIPFAIFGIFHFMSADMMAGMAPGGVIMVYLTGVALIAAAVSIIIGKMDKLAAVLLGVMLLIFAALVHAPNIASDQMEMMNVMKNIIMAGGAFMYAAHASDHSVLG